MGRLTTHVLDTVAGRPAGGLKVELFRDNDTNPVVVAQTNSEGRLDAAMVEGTALSVGVYEIRFHVADYFRAIGMRLPDPPFLDVVPVRFGIAEPMSHYHVPLLISPYAYSTYRGS
jgi:5-hydroxyisourate hydrolase